MKTTYFIFLFFISSISFGQTYSYSLKTVKANVQTSNGNEYRVLNRYSGPYRFVFETPRNEKKLFTLLRPDENIAPGQPWYSLLKDMGYIEKDNILYKKSIYYYTGDDEQVMVLISNDYNKIIIFNKDDTIWEFTDK